MLESQKEENANALRLRHDDPCAYMVSSICGDTLLASGYKSCLQL